MVHLHRVGARLNGRSLVLAGLIGALSAWVAGCGSSPGEMPDAGPPCASHTCSEPDTVCVEERGVAECVCREGTVPDATGACVVPSSCEADTCNRHGECTEVDGEVVCECEPDFGGPLCERCADGLHDDGMGGCTADLCVPNPCPTERRCEVVDGEATCACPAGMHEEAGECVEDQECTDTTCSGHGICTDDDLRPSCACDEGWAGAFCDRCDE
ncbi:MAG: hypothetical protein GWO04_44525, partial [Actinobacteria bacterium]|nr:hypothetical protein [Actinomycetota bacterium]NIW33024.1 hypothetical protein [Actinomycetota bacterium]